MWMVAEAGGVKDGAWEEDGGCGPKGLPVGRLSCSPWDSQSATIAVRKKAGKIWTGVTHSAAWQQAGRVAWLLVQLCRRDGQVYAGVCPENGEEERVEGGRTGGVIGIDCGSLLQLKV